MSYQEMKTLLKHFLALTMCVLIAALYCGPFALLAFGWNPALLCGVLLSLFFPALIYYLVLRAITEGEFT